MKITVQHEKLARALNFAVRAVNSKPNIPVLANFLLTVEKGVLQIGSTNLDMGINLWIAGNIEQEGKVTVAAKLFTDFVTATTGSKVTLELVDNTLKVITDRSAAELQTIPASEFPILPSVSGEASISVNPESLVNALNKVIFACAVESIPGKTQQTGVYFELSQEDNIVTMVGLDGYRLSEVKLKVKRIKNEEFKIIVPAKALQELTKIITSEPELESVDIYLKASNAQVLFKVGELEFSVGLLEGPYVEYKQVIPGEYNFQCEIDRKELEEGIKVINTFARSVLGNRTEFDVDPDDGKIVMGSTITDLGKNRSEVKIYSPEGNELKAAYNLRYLAEMVAAMGANRIIFQTKSALGPAVFKDKDNNDFLHLIMPLKRDV